MSKHVDKKIQPLTPESKKWIVEGISEGINIKQMNDLKEKSKDLKQLGEVAMDAKEQTDQLAESLERVDGKEVNVNIKTSTETEDNSQLKGIRNSIDKKYVEQKRIDLNQLASKWRSEQSKEQDADKKIDLLVKAQTAEKLKTSSTDQIKTNDIKAIIESAAEGNQQLIDQANKMYGSSENYSAFKGKVIEVISDGLQKINTKVDESFVEMSDVLNTAISQYKKNNDLTSATNVMKIVNQILAKNSKYDFTADQKKTFEDIGKNNAYSRYIYGQDSEGNSGKLSDAYKILLDKTKSSDERMDQLIEVAKTMSGISSAFDRYNLANLKGDANVNQALAKTFRDLTNGRTGVTTVTALKDVIIEPSNSAKLNQNQTAIKNLIDIFKGSGARTPNPDYGEIVKSLIEYVNSNTTDNTFDYDTTKAKGKLTLKRNKSGNSDENDPKEMDKQRKSLEKERNEIENKYLKQLNKTSSAGAYMHQYDQLMAAVKAYRQNADEFSQKFGQEIYRFPEFPESYNEDTLETMTNSLAEIFELIEKYNDLVSYAQSNGGDPQNARSIFQSVSETFTQLTNVVSEFEKSYGLKFKSSESIQVYAGKYQKLNDGFTSELTSKTKGFINENIQISDKRIEIQKLSEDIINFQEELAPLVAKLKPAIDTEGAEVNKSDLDAFTELVDKIKTAGETISGMNMREAMKSKLGTKAQSKLNGVQTWEEYIETLNTRTIIDDTGEKDEKKSGDGEGNGSGDGSGSGASLEEIQKALEPVEGKITDVKTAVEQLDTDLGNKLDTINNTIENNKPDVNLDVDSVYDKFRDDVVAIRTGVEKVASNFDQGENPSSTKKTEVITEYLANLLTDSNEIMIPVDYKKEASMFNKGQNEARKVIDELESKYNNNEELLKQIDDHLMDYISNKVDLSGINESFDIVPAQGYVEYMTNYMKTQDNEKYFKNSRFNTERVNVNDDLMSDIFNNSFIEEAERTGKWISDFETNLNRAEQIIKELAKPHSLPMIIESLEDLKSIISNDYFNPSDYIRVGGREFNYLSPVTGKSQSIYFDQEERSDSQASGYPSFIEFIDKDLNFLKNLLDTKNANKESANIENTQDSKTVNQILTDATSKLESIVNYLGESKKSDVEIDVDGIYDKFKDDIIAIRKGIEKVANNFDEATEVKTQDSVKIPEHLSKLIDESAGYGYVPTVSREHTNEIREQGYSIGLQIIDEIEKSLMSNIEGSNIASIMRNLQFNEKDSSTNATYSYDPNFVKSILEIITKLAAQSKNQAVSIDQITKELAVPEKGYAHGGQILYKQADAMLALETVQGMNDSSGSGNNTFDLSFAQQIFENLASFFDQYGEMFDSLAANDDLSEAKQDEASEISERLVDASNKIADQLKISRTQKSEDGEIYSNEEIQNNLINVAKEVYDDLEDLSMSIEQYKTFTGNDKKIQDSKYVIQSIIKDIQNDVISKIVSDNGIQTSQSGKIIEYDDTGDTKKKNIQVTVDKSQINEIIKILDRSIGSAWREEGNYSKILSEIDKYIIANRPSDEQSPAEWLKFSGIRGSLIGAQEKIGSDYGDYDSQYLQYRKSDTTKISSQNKLFNAIAKNFDNLTDAQQNMEQLSIPHKLKDLLSYLTRIRNVVDAMYFGNDAAEFVNDKYSLKYVSPINGSSTQYELDATKDRTSPESGLPQFLEAIDSDIKFLTELSEQIKDKPEVKEPIVEKKTVNAMLSELIAQIGELSQKMDQGDNSDPIDKSTKNIDSVVENIKSDTEKILSSIQDISKSLVVTKTNTSNRQSENVYDKYKYILDLATKDGLNDVSEKFGKYDKPDKIRWDKRDSERYSLIDRGTEMFSHKTIVGVLDKYVDTLGKKYGVKWVEELAKSESTSGIQNGKDAAEIINRMSSILNDILIGKGSEWTGMSAESTKSLQNALISQGDSIVDAEGTVHTSLENILKLQEDCSAAQEMIASLGKLYTESNIVKTMGFLNYDKPPAYGNANFFKQLYVQQNHPELQSEKTTTTTSIGGLIDSNTQALNKNTAALEKLFNEGLNLSQDNISVETEDVLAQIQEIRRTLQDTQTATEAAGFKDIADTINNQVIPQIQKKNDNIIAEKKLVDKTVTAEVNRFTELANTIKNKVSEAITAKNTLLENDLNNTKAIVDQQIEYVRQLVDSIRDMFAMSDNPEDMTKANALILEFKATENLTDNYRKEVADTLVELDKLWNTGKIEEYQNKFIELTHILESHQKQQKTNVNKDELAYLKEEAQQIKDVLGYTRGVKGQKTPTLISKEMIDSLGSSVDLLNQIYGAKGKGWRQAQEHEKGITWQDLRFMDAEDKRYTGATIVNDQDMEDAEFFMTYATKLLDTLEKIKNLSVETEIGGMLGNEQYYAQATNELENRLNSVVGKNYNAFPNPVENDALEGFEEVITDAEAQQKAADELEQRLTANGAQTTIVQMIDLLSTKMSELKKYIDGIANETTSAIFANLASDIGAIYQAITLIPEGGMPDLLGSNKDNVSKLANLQSSIQSIYASITNNQQATMDAPLSNLNVTLSPEGVNHLTTQIANAIAAGEYTIKKFKVADDTRVASKIQAVINSEDPIVVSKFVVSPQKSINFSNQLSQIITNSGSISLKSFDVNSANIGEVRQDIETKLNEKPIKLNNWEAGNFKRINNLVAEGVAKSISDDIQKGLDEKKLILKNWEIKGIQAKINEALKQSPVTVEDFKVGNLANAKQDIAKKIGATKITFDENNPIDIDALNVKTITISDEVAQKIKPIPVTVNPTNLDELVTQITDAFEVGTSKVIKLPNQAAYNTQKTNIAELVGEFETVVKSAQDYAEAIYSITDAIKSVFEQSKPMLNEINASVNNMLNGLHLLNGTNQQESKSNTELYYEDLIKNAKNAQMRMQAGNTSVRGEAYISAMNDEYTKLISLLEQAKDGEGEFDSKLASDIKEQRTVISEMENSFKELEKTANEAERKLAAAEARIAQAAADNLESPYTEEENKLLQDLRDMVARARNNVSQGTSGEINSALREALEMVYENVNTDGLDQSMLDRLREPVVVDYSDPEKYVKEYAESGLKVKEQLEDANSNLVKALTETQRDDLSKKYYDFAELLQKIVNGDVELNADTDKEVSAAYKEIMDAFNKSIGKSSTQQNQKQKVIDVNLLNKYKKELEKYNNQLAKYHDGTAVNYQDKINKYSPEIDRIIEGSKNITDDTSPEAVALKQSYDELIQNIKTMKDGSEGGSGGLTKYLDTKKSAAEIDRLNKKFDELIAKIQVYVKNNSKLTTDPEVKAQFQALLSDAQSATRSAAEYDRLNASLSQLKATVSNKGLTGRSLGDDIKYIAERIGIKAALSNSIYKVIGYFRQMVTTVTELDTGMTALKRVTQETQRVYTDFLKSTTSNAQALGATMSEVVNATTSFSKLGFNLQEAQTLANNAIIYKTVGDIDINTATNDMISTMKAFNMEASQSEHIVDAFDIINNKYAISAQQVGEGLKGSAAALATANNTFEESAAM